MIDLDNVDLSIIGHLRADARISQAEIARRIGIAGSAVSVRLRRLQDRGVIAAFETRLDPEKFGYGLLAFIGVVTSDSPGSVTTGETVAAWPEVLEVHHTVGDTCLLLKVRIGDNRELAELLRRLGQLPTVHSTRTTIAIETLKETGVIPLRSAVSEPYVR